MHYWISHKTSFVNINYTPVVYNLFTMELNPEEVDLNAEDVDLFGDESVNDDDFFKDEPFKEDLFAPGEDMGIDIGRDAARSANKRVRNAGDNEFIDLPGHGEIPARDSRFRDSAKKGFLTAYVRTREYASEHETATKIAISTLAIGAVLAGAAALKHRRKS
jgi:hypothetical protein